MIRQFQNLRPRLTAQQIVDGINADIRKDKLTVQRVMWRDQPRRRRMKWLACACVMAAVVLFSILMVRL